MPSCDKGHVRIEWATTVSGPFSCGPHLCPVCLRESDLRHASKTNRQLRERIKSLELAAKRKSVSRRRPNARAGPKESGTV